MATVNKHITKGTTRKYIPGRYETVDVEDTTYTLKLSEYEARVLRSVTQRVGGACDARDAVDQIGSALHEAAVKPHIGTDLDVGAIYF